MLWYVFDVDQVFLKQIRPNENDLRSQKDEDDINNRRPLPRDYVNGYMMWLLSFFFPGLHQFYLGNFWRGVLYLFTLNLFFAGWILDLFEMHILIQKSVQEYGHAPGVCYCNCCFRNPFCCFCCCCPKAVVDVDKRGKHISAQDDLDANV